MANSLVLLRPVPSGELAEWQRLLHNNLNILGFPKGKGGVSAIN